MTDVVLLKKKVSDSGLKPKVIYERLGISKAAWYKKVNGQSPFKVGEIQLLCEILHITSLREKDQIFFANL